MQRIVPAFRRFFQAFAESRVSRDAAAHAKRAVAGHFQGKLCLSHEAVDDRFLKTGRKVGQGHVVDFLDYNGWFIGNIADIWIVGAAGLIIVLALWGVGVDGRRERRAAPVTQQPEEPQRPEQREKPEVSDEPGERSDG